MAQGKRAEFESEREKGIVSVSQRGKKVFLLSFLESDTFSLNFAAAFPSPKYARKGEMWENPEPEGDEL